LPNNTGLEFSAVCIPAHGISGDYYDVLEFAVSSDGRIRLKEGGLPLGLFPDSTYPVGEVLLNPKRSPGAILRRHN
jgi:serine phosphatase RsbU (regulator of sigma subunit)